MKVVLKNVGEEPIIADWEKDMINCVYNHDVIKIDEFQGLYLYIEKNAEDKNFRIEHMSRDVKGYCFLAKLSKDVTENELELMKCIVANNTLEVCRRLK